MPGIVIPRSTFKSIKQAGKIVIIKVPEGDEKPYSSSAGYYRRLDSVTQKMTQKEVRALFRETDTVSFEALTCKDLSPKDISLAKVKAFLKESGTSYKISRANLSLVLSSLGVSDREAK